jgi:hypothetical protein
MLRVLQGELPQHPQAGGRSEGDLQVVQYYFWPDYPGVVVGPGCDVTSTPGTTRLLICPIPRLDQPRIFAKTVMILQNLKVDTDAGKIESKLLGKVQIRLTLASGVVILRVI